MSSAFLQKTGKKLFAAHIENYAPADPLYEQYIDKKGRKKRRKRELPPGLSARDVKVLQSVKRRAHHLDKGFQLCGLRFGWAFIIGIIPGAGDVADIFLNYYLVVVKAREADLPGWLVRRMLLNNSVSAIVGIVPFVGDILLAQFKANSRNAALLEEYLRIRGEVYLQMKAEGKDVVPVGTPKRKAKGKGIGLFKGKDGKSSTAKRGSEKEKVEKVDVGGGKEAVIPKGTTKSDAEQIKPGAGLKDGEVVPDGKEKAAAVVAELSSTTTSDVKAPGKRKISLNLWRGKDASTDVEPSSTTSDSPDVKTPGKRKISLNPWRGGDTSTGGGKGKEAAIPKGAAGLKDGEVVPDGKEKAAAIAVEPCSTTSATPGVKTTGKRKLSFNPWRGKDTCTGGGKGKQVDDRGRFVEHLTSEEDGEGVEK